MVGLPGKAFRANPTATGHVPVYKANGTFSYVVTLVTLCALIHTEMCVLCSACCACAFSCDLCCPILVYMYAVFIVLTGRARGGIPVSACIGLMVPRECYPSPPLLRTPTVGRGYALVGRSTPLLSTRRAFAVDSLHRGYRTCRTFRTLRERERVRRVSYSPITYSICMYVAAVRGSEVSNTADGCAKKIVNVRPDAGLTRRTCTTSWARSSPACLSSRSSSCCS